MTKTHAKILADIAAKVVADYRAQDHNESCGSCGADIGPSDSFPWHLDVEDCRAVRDPVPDLQTRIAAAAAAAAEADRTPDWDYKLDERWQG